MSQMVHGQQVAAGIALLQAQGDEVFGRLLKKADKIDIQNPCGCALAACYGSYEVGRKTLNLETGQQVVNFGFVLPHGSDYRDLNNEWRRQLALLTQPMALAA